MRDSRFPDSLFDVEILDRLHISKGDQALFCFNVRRSTESPTKDFRVIQMRQILPRRTFWVLARTQKVHRSQSPLRIIPLETSGFVRTPLNSNKHL